MSEAWNDLLLKFYANTPFGRTVKPIGFFVFYKHRVIGSKWVELGHYVGHLENQQWKFAALEVHLL